MKNPIKTTDNNLKGEPFDTALHLDNLQHLAAKPLCELCLDERPNLLIFPVDFKTHGDDIGKQHIFTIENERLITGNIMGFIGYHDTQVSIRSRFAQDDCHDYFIHYMLQRVFAINLFDLKTGTDNESIFDFLIYLFPSFLKKAMRNGIYKEYQTREHNDTNVRGRIDVSRHIRQNIPFTGKVSYTTREYVTDNRLTQLIRHTIEYIAQHPFNGNILNNDEDTKVAVSKIRQVTKTYNRGARHQIVNQNLRPVRHPYFSEYRNLQHLCLQILRQEGIKYGYDGSPVYGVLFDGAWLWEEYLNTVLSDAGFLHPRNKTGEGGKRIFADKIGNETVMSDFHKAGIVLDAKYKSYSNWKEVTRDDRFQLLAYMHLYDAGRSGFIVPVCIPPDIKTTRSLNGRGGTMSIIGMNVATICKNYNEFSSHMAQEEKLLIQKLEQIFAG
jgi:5-methylcytosine-specific restriction endonuclease McrBC regulatory subunit McrC